MNMTKEQKLDIAKKFVESAKKTSEVADVFEKAVSVISGGETSHAFFHSPFETFSCDMLNFVLGDSLAGWVFWYVYDADFGTDECMVYSIDHVKYAVAEQTFEEFFMTVSNDE